MNTHDFAPSPAPSPACARFAPMLPRLDDDTLPRDALTGDALAVEARAHLRTCAHCQAEHALYARLDRALRQHYAVTSVAQRPTEEIMSYIADRASGTRHQAPAPSITSGMPHPRAPRRSWLSGLAAAASVAALIALVVALFAMRGNAGYGGPPRYAFPGTTGTFASLSMVSPTEGWALAQVLKTPQSAQPLDQVTFYHDLDGTWTPVTIKTRESFAVGGVSGFNGTISMDSSTDGWAVAHNFNQVSALLHYSNGTWSEVPAPYLATIQAFGPHAVWVILDDLSNVGGSIARYDGSNWVVQTLPGVPTTTGVPTPTGGNAAVGATAANPTPATTPGANVTPTPAPTPPAGGNAAEASAPAARVIAMQMTSDNAGYALVSDGNARYAIDRYANGTWSGATSAFSAGDVADFTTFAMVSPREGWALGQMSVPDSHGITTHVPLRELVYHYANGKWTSVPIPVDSGTFTTLETITMRSASDGWIVGSQQSAYRGATTSDFQQHPVLYHWNGSQWQAVRVPQTGTPVAGLTALTFTADGKGWAVGYVSNIPASQVVQDTDILAQASPLVWTFDGTTWSMLQG